MKLNPDCVRDVLLYLEENLSYADNIETGTIEHKSIAISKITEDLHKNNNYNSTDVKYSIEKLLEARYITTETISRGHNNSIIYCPISDITWSGHQFLNTVRPKTIWKATKEKAKQFGGMSIGTLSMLSVELTKAVITHPDYIQKIVDQINTALK